MDHTYIHTVQYYETDKMGITHHSNYIRWMEEARVDYLSKIGWDYARLEELGIVSPVLSISCDYRNPTYFSDLISISVRISEFKGVKLYLAYEMINQKGDVVCQATSAHAFLNTEGKPIRMKQEFPEFYHTLNRMVSDQES